MNIVTDQFKNLISTETNDFSLILDVIIHSKKEVGRQFLNFINHIVDHYIYTSQANDSINIQIIHLPACENWTKELFLCFITYKIALFHNKTTLNRFKSESIKIINTNDNREAKRLHDRHKYLRRIYKMFENNKSIKDNKSTNLLIVKENDLITTKKNKDLWLSEYFVPIKNISDSQYNLCVDSQIDTFSLENMFENDPFQIENIFIIHTRNKVTRSYSKNQLERLNRYNANIKNCFIFSFSDQPFVIDKIKNFVKSRLVSVYNQTSISKYNDFGGFITVTQQESDYIFGRQSNTQRLIIDSDDREIFTEEIEIFIEDIPQNLKFRNQLALCFCDKLQYQISNIISDHIPEFNNEMCSGFYSILSQVWEKDIIATIQKFIANSSSVALIVDKNTSITTKKLLMELFKKPQTKFKFYHFEDLKKKHGENSIDRDQIIIFQYRSPNGRFSIYPNILEQLPLNQGQEALIVINKLTHNNIFEWDIYWYYRLLNSLLYSKFREEVLEWKFLKLNRPQSEGQSIKNLIDEEELDNYRNHHTDKCKVRFKNQIKEKEIPLYENVIFLHDEKYSIDEIRSILELTDLSLQQLNDITDTVKTLINAKIEANNYAELIVRNESRFNLTEEEKKSTTELWKILLKKKVEKETSLKVYNDIFQKLPQTERISFNAFNQWYNLNSTTILPRSRKDQKAVLAYLGFELNSAYHKIIIKKKLSNINGSRKMNSLIESFLKDYLFSDNTEAIFCQCRNEYSDFLELIDANTYKNFIALKSLILQEIDLKPVESIEYDKI